MWAAQNGRPEVVKLLLADKADPMARDREGNTALSLAREYQQNDIAEMLQIAGGVIRTSSGSVEDKTSSKSTSVKAKK